MPEIVEHGDPARFPDAWPRYVEWKCLRCGCRFRLGPDDRAKITDDQRDGMYASFPCPDCAYPTTRARR